MKNFNHILSFKMFNETNQARKKNYSDNTPFYGMHGVTATPGEGPAPDKERDGEQPETPIVLKKDDEDEEQNNDQESKKMRTNNIIKKRKEKDKRINIYRPPKQSFQIDQDQYKKHMKTREPGKSFGAGSTT